MTGAEGVNFCTVRIDSNKCDYCMECVNTCPNGALCITHTVVHTVKYVWTSANRKQLKYWICDNYVLFILY